MASGFFFSYSHWTSDKFWLWLTTGAKYIQKQFLRQSWKNSWSWRLITDNPGTAKKKNHSWFCLNIQMLRLLVNHPFLFEYCVNASCVLKLFGCGLLFFIYWYWKVKVCSIQLVLVKNWFYCEPFQWEYVLPFAICVLCPQLNRFSSFMWTIVLIHTDLIVIWLTSRLLHLNFYSIRWGVWRWPGKFAFGTLCTSVYSMLLYVCVFSQYSHSHWASTIQFWANRIPFHSKFALNHLRVVNWQLMRLTEY